MSAAVLFAVFVAAALHATWNAILKAASDKSFGSVLVAATASVIAAVLLPFLPQPAPESWPFIAASCLCQTAYFTLLAFAYRFGDMSQTYPLMRGTAPLIVAVASGPLVGEALALGEWVGLATISAGVIGLSLIGRMNASGRATVFALLNALVIAAYTLIDGLGVRRSGAPVAYTLWVVLVPAFPLVGWAVFRRGGAFLAYARRNLGLGFVGGFSTMTSYGLALWAMTHAPVAVVAALRETSIIFATAISAFVLKETIGAGKLAVTAAIAMGAIVLRLA